MTAPRLQVLEPGMLSTVQDGGRHGFFHLGLTNGGMMDTVSGAWANRLCGNADDAALIEIAVGGAKLIALSKMQIAVTGAKASLTINGQVQKQWQTLTLNKGDEIAVGYADTGFRCYLAVAGGLDVPPQFGSQSTVVREGVGGLNGSALKAGDVLVCHTQGQIKPLRLSDLDQPQFDTEVLLRLVPGYQYQFFGALARHRFFSESFALSDQADRMGARLTGPTIPCEIAGILSEGIAYGAVQVPADGQPIILLNDRQTIGGYPKIGTVLSHDLVKLAQLKPGGRIRFEAVSVYQAQAIHHLTMSQMADARKLVNI